MTSHDVKKHNKNENVVFKLCRFSLFLEELRTRKRENLQNWKT